MEAWKWRGKLMGEGRDGWLFPEGMENSGGLGGWQGSHAQTVGRSSEYLWGALVQT